ncbi:hypothetical protein GCM10019016_039350 [Streptomyces prasinosporus]|uniref:Uncharacterized protein n=1 Tax=Streptomyces prasinosporus TaxID=68256 RepID=A0ABP6TQM4_9ACTN
MRVMTAPSASTSVLTAAASSTQPSGVTPMPLPTATVAARPSGETPEGRGAFGHGVGVSARGGHDLVELEMDGAEARSDHVPVDLLGHQGEVDQIDQGALQCLRNGLQVLVGQRALHDVHPHLRG